MLHRMAVDTDADREVVEEDQLVARERTRVVGCDPCRSEWQAVPHRAHRDPRGAAAIRLPGTEGTGACEMQRIGPLQLCPLHHVVDRREAVPSSRGFQRIEGFLTEPADMTPAD